MAFTEFCCRSGGSNLNAGTRTGNATEPGTAADLTYASGTWVQGTGVFTVASGDPAADGVAVGDFASVYPDAATVTPFVGRVTARDATTITVSTTIKSGTAPVDGTTNTTLKIGGAWKGPNGAEDFPFDWIQNTMVNAAGDTPRVNLKNDAEYDVSATVTVANAGPIQYQGYTTAYGDGGKFVIDAQGGNFHILTVTGANCTYCDGELKNNGTGTVNGVAVNGSNSTFIRMVVHDVRGLGFQGAGVNATVLVECEVYAWCQRATGGDAAFNIAGTGSAAIRCIAHDSGASGVGFRTAGAVINCIADTCGGDGFQSQTSGNNQYYGCDAYNNGGDGFDLLATSYTVFVVENCNAVKNGGWGINGSGAGTRSGIVSNCGFGSGTMANTSGTTTGLKSMVESGSITYTANTAPWVDPANGDFSVSLAAASNAGRGTFTQTASGYAGTVGYPVIGAAQRLVSLVVAGVGSMLTMMGMGRSG